MDCPTPVSNIHNWLVTLYNLSRHVTNKFNATYGAAKSHLQMKRAVYEHFFSSVSSTDWLSLLQAPPMRTL